MSTIGNSILKAEGLSKTFKVGFLGRSVTAVHGLDLDVRKGEVFGFLGPNGAGKTTTIKMLMGLIYPTSGQAWLFGRPIGDQESKARLGFLPESPYFYDYLTGIEFLQFYGHLFGLRGAALGKRIDELLDLVGMSHASHLQLRKFSKGMLQRVGIAQALINDPELVVLDEPMSGLDPIGRKEIRDLILRLKEAGKTIFFSSHILHDAELLCDRVAIILKGRQVACGRVSDLIDEGATHSVEVVIDGLGSEGLVRLRQLADRVIIQGPQVLAVLPSRQQVGQVLEIIRGAKATLVSLTPQKGSLEDLFIREVKSKQPELREAV
ncbi:MAG: ABC transporter ATP-binding protein [Nitrospira sp.]|nr:MAG: ABC transporter ATP-binding protein [Nitrospira sp.]